jgi:hypothetical protein
MKIKYIFYYLFCCLFYACLSGDEIYIEPECETFIIDSFSHSDGVTSNRHFSGDNDTFILKSSSGQLFNYTATSKIEDNILNECESTYVYEVISYKAFTEDLAPKISTTLWFRFQDTISEPMLTVIVGSFISYTSLNTMKAVDAHHAYPTDNNVSFHSSLSVMDTTYNEVYLIEKNNYLNNEIKSIVYSITDGLLGFYRDEEVYWKVL